MIANTNQFKAAPALARHAVAIDTPCDWVAMQDIERIEALRGPMSVLYGAEALGGVVNIITRAPGERWALRTLAEGAWADAGLGGDGHRAAVSVDGPLAPGWRRAGAWRRRHPMAAARP